MKNHLTSTLIIALIAVLLTACALPPNTPDVQATPPLPLPSPTADLCAPANLPTEADHFSRLMREFDDVAYLAGFTPQAQLAQVLMQLQAVKRRAADTPAPPCLGSLKTAAVEYMKKVVNYMVLFMGGAGGEQINAEIAASQSLRAIYDAELARLSGSAYTPPAPTQNNPAAAAPAATPNVPPAAQMTPLQPPAALPTASATAPPPPTATPALPVVAPPAPGGGKVTVTNPNAEGIYLRAAPSGSAPTNAYLEGRQTVQAIGRSPAGDWLMLAFPNAPSGTAWVLSVLVKVSGTVEALPVIPSNP